jgi:hypothetical protein
VKALHLRSNNLSCDIPQQICQEIQNLWCICTHLRGILRLSIYY